MDYLLPTFKTVSVMFAISAVATGAQAVVDPVGFWAASDGDTFRGVSY